MTLKALLAAFSLLVNTETEHPERVMSAVLEASQGDARVAALLLAVGYHESRFVDRIQAGQCRRWECDPIQVRGELRFQARSYWQLHRSACASGAEWRSTTGLAPENITAAAAVAGRRLRRGLAACRTYEGVVSYFAYGSCRPWPGAKRRAAMAMRVEARLTPRAGSGKGRTSP